MIEVKKGGRPRKKSHAGRPFKIDDSVLNLLKQAFALDASIEEACYYANISHQTFYNFKKNNAELFEELERLRERPVLVARRTVVKEVEKNPELALKYLERKRKKEFSLRTELTGKNGEKLESGWTPDHALKVLEAYNKKK